MKITKYPQSCFVLGSADKKIMIDPGSFFAQKFSAKDFLDVSAVLITHKHGDHMDLNSLKIFSDNKVPIYGNAEVVTNLVKENIVAHTVEDRKRFKIAGFEIEPIAIAHCKVPWCDICKSIVHAADLTPKKRCKLHPDKEAGAVSSVQCTGFLINEMFFDPGDGSENINIHVRNLAVPIVGPTIDYDSAWKFALHVQAKLVIPTHYDHPNFVNRDPKEFARLKPKDIDIEILKDGESAELK